MASVHEILTQQFRKWELRGRGWKVHSAPVCLEPPFIPFDAHYLPSSPTIDDGRRPTFLSSLVQKLSHKMGGSPSQSEAFLGDEEPDPIPLVRNDLIELQISIPDDLDVSTDAFQQFVLNLSLCHEPIAFELLV